MSTLDELRKKYGLNTSRLDSFAAKGLTVKGPTEMKSSPPGATTPATPTAPTTPATPTAPTITTTTTKPRTVDDISADITAKLREKDTVRQQLNTYSFENNGAVDKSLSDRLTALETEVDALEIERDEARSAAAEEAQLAQIQSYAAQSGKTVDQYFTKENLANRQKQLESQQKNYEAWLAKVNVQADSAYDVTAYTNLAKELQDKIAAVKEEMAFIANSYATLGNADTKQRVEAAGSELYTNRKNADAALQAVYTLQSTAGGRANSEQAKAAVTTIEQVLGLDFEKAYKGNTATFAEDALTLAQEKSLQAQRAWESAGFTPDEYKRYAMLEQRDASKVEYEASQTRWAEFAEDHPVIASVMTVGASPFQGLDFVNQTAKYAGHSDITNLESYVPADVYDMGVTNFVSGVRGAVSSRLSDRYTAEMLDQNVASFLYNTGMSAVDSMTQVALLGSGSVYLMSMGAAANTAKEVIQRGGTNKQAFAMGLAAGAAEALCEKYSVEGLVKILKTDKILGGKQVLAEILKQGGTEASEELVTEIANILADVAIMQEKSDYKQTVKAYTAAFDGDTAKAEKQAFIDAVKQVGAAAAGGFLSGGLSAGVYSTATNVQNGQLGMSTAGVGKAVSAASGQSDEITKGLGANKGSDAYELAQKAQSEIEKRGKVSDATMGKLVIANSQEVGRAIQAATENGSAVAVAEAQAVMSELNATGTVTGASLARLRAAAVQHVDVSPAASQAVQQMATQAAETASSNPDVDVQGAAVSLIMERQPMKLQTAQTRAAIIERLVKGEQVSDKELNKIDPTNATTQQIFSELTGVTFPEGRLQIEQLRAIYRSAHSVAQAVKAQKQVEATAMREDVAAAAIPEKVQSVQESVKTIPEKVQSEELFDAAGNHLATQAQFAAEYKRRNPEAGIDEIDAQYGRYLRDNATVSMNGQRLNLQQFGDTLRKLAPNGDQITDDEITGLFSHQLAAESQKRNPEYQQAQKAVQKAGQKAQETTQKLALDAINRALKPFGLSAVLDNTMADNVPGFVGADGVIHFNANTLTTEKALIWTLGHEVLHNAPAEFVQEVIKAFQQLNDAGAVTSAELKYQIEHQKEVTDGISDRYLAHLTKLKKQELEAQGKELDVEAYQKHLLENGVDGQSWSEYILEEYAADLLRSLFVQDLTIISRMAGVNPTILERALAKWQQMKPHIGTSKQDAEVARIYAELESKLIEGLKKGRADATYRKPGEVLNEDGDVIVESNDTGHSRFSLSTYEAEGRELLARWMSEAVNRGDLTDADALDIMRSLDVIYDICKEYKGQYGPFDAWSEAKVVVNENGDPVFSVVKANGDYAMNLDFSLVCKKRRTLDAVLNSLVEKGLVDNLALNEKQIVKINELIRSYGFETACDLCFVDAKRYRQGKVADDFVKLYNKLVQSLVPKNSGLKPHYFNFGGSSIISNDDTGIHELPDAKLDFSYIDEVLRTKGDQTVEYKAAKLLKSSPADRKLVTRGDFLSTRGFDAVNKENPRVLKLFNSKKGSGGPKSAVSDVQYLNEVLSSRSFSAEKAYAVGGVRVQSFSDYVPRMVFDYVQMIADLAAKKLPAHAYTKEELFVKQFGLTGMKINMSLIPKVVDGGVAPGLDADGNYAWADESFDFDEAIRIQHADGYSRNCGTIAVGISDEHIRALMADPEIRMVIPYHKSGLSPIVAKMNKINKFVNYTDFQNTRRPNGKRGKKLSKDVAADKKLLDTMPDFNSKMRELGDPRSAAEAYVRWCEENDLLPKFDQFAYKQIDGVYVEKDGQRVIDENYYKLLEDFTVYDNGEYVEQTGLTMTFPDETGAFGSMAELVKRGLEEDALLEAKRDADVPKIVDDISKMKFMIVGENAKYAPKAQLAVAKVARAVGVGPRGTQLFTGWWRGADGEWRFEIDDSKASLKPSWRDAKTVGQILKHPELFRQYPALRRAPVVFSDRDSAAYASFIPSTSSFEISKDILDSEIKETILHEMQHWVQQYEAFAGGDSVYRAYQDAFIAAFDSVKNTSAFKSLSSYADRVDLIEREMVRKAGGDYLAKDISAGVKKAATDEYFKSIGEQEAFNTEDRAELTTVQRRLHAPYFADEGKVTTRDYKNKAQKAFIDLHKALGWDGVDKVLRTEYTKVKDAKGENRYVDELYGERRELGMGDRRVLPKGISSVYRTAESGGRVSSATETPKSVSATLGQTEQETLKASEKSGAFISAEEVASPEALQARYSIIDDTALIERLEEDDYITVYKAMVQIDGELYPPMSSQEKVTEEYTDKKGNVKTRTVRKLKNPSILGRWQKSDERPDLVKEFQKPNKKYPDGYGKFELLKSDNSSPMSVAYNPYEHTSNIVLNDQFATAYKRPELVTVEFHIPKSEATGLWDADMQQTGKPYKAQYAKDPVGLTDWKAGGVAQKLKNSHRDVYLTRWSKPVRVLSDAEVAQKYKEILDKEKGIMVPWNVVTPSLRHELEALGVTIDYSDAQAGENTVAFADYFPEDYAKLPKPTQRKAALESERKAKQRAEKAAKKAAKVKYSVIDSSGQLLSEDQQKYFENSKARDYMGRLMTMFHGTKSFGFTVFDPKFSDDGISLFFTDAPETARSYTGTKGNDIRAISKDTDMSPYDHEGSFDTEEDAWKYLESRGYRKLSPEPLSVEQLKNAARLTTENAVEEAQAWLEALETTLPEILPPNRMDISRRNSLAQLKKNIEDLDDLVKNPEDSAVYDDVLNGAMHVLFDAEEVCMYNLSHYRDYVSSDEGRERLEELKEAIFNPDYSRKHWARLVYAIGYNEPSNIVYAPGQGSFHLPIGDETRREAYNARSDAEKGLYEVYLNLENPLIIDGAQSNWNDLSYDDLGDYGGNSETYWEGDTTREIAEYAKENGYDGVIFRNIFDVGHHATGAESAANVMIAFKSEQVKSTANEHPTGDVDIRYSINPEYTKDVLKWARNGKPNGEVFFLGTTSDVLMGLGAQENDIYLRSEKVNEILANHPGMTLTEIKKIPQILEDPVLIFKSRNRNRKGKQNTRVVIFGSEKSATGTPITVVLDLRPVENGATVSDMQKVVSSYGKLGDLTEFVKHSYVMYADKKRATSVLQSMGLHGPIEVLQSGSTGNVAYRARNVNLYGEEFSEVFNAPNTRYSITPEAEEWLKQNLASTPEQQTELQAEIDRLRTLYGDIPAGERPAREVQMPRKNTSGARVNDTVQTVMEAKATPEKRLESIQQAVVDGELADVPVANTTRVRKARAKIKRNGWEASLTDWTTEVRSGHASADLVAEGAILLNNAGNSDMTGERYVELLNDYADLMHRVGNSLQAARILKRLSPEGKLYGVQGVVRKLNNKAEERASKRKGFDPETWANQNAITIDPALIDAYRKAQTDEERDAILDRIQQNIADQMPASLVEKLNNWRYLAMLGNFRTQIRNVGGNLLFQIPRAIKDTIAGGIEGTLAHMGVNIERSQSAFVDSESFKAAWADFTNVRDIILSGGKVDEKTSYLDGISAKRRIYRNAILEGYRKVVNTAMDEGDAVFSRYTYAESLARFMAANGTTWAQASEALRERGRRKAIMDAAEATYRDNNAFSNLITKARIKNPENLLEKGVNAVIEGILPFKKTPANILVRGIEYSPLGLIKTSVDAARLAAGSEDVTGSEVINEMAKTITGSGLFMLGYFMVKAGLLAALGPDEDKEKDFWELQGNQSYAIVWNGKSYTIDWLAPEAIPLLAGANTAEVAMEDGLDLNTGVKALSRVTDPMLEMSMLQGVNDLLENIANTKTVSALPTLVANSVWSYGLQYVPTLLGQAERAADNTRRTTYTDSESGVPTGVQYALGKLSQKIPLWDFAQIPYIDQWGRMEQNYESEIGNAFAQFLSPSYKSVIDTSEMEQELQRLYDMTGESGVLPPTAPKYFTVDGEKRNLTAAEYVTYATVRGQTARELLMELTTSAAYLKLDDAGKVKAVKDVYSYASDVAKAAILGDSTPESTSKGIAKVQDTGEYGVSSAEYMAIRAETNAFDSLKDKNGDTITNSKALRIMEYVYSVAPDLKRDEYEALFEALGVGSSVRGYRPAMVSRKLEQMRKKAQ